MQYTLIKGTVSRGFRLLFFFPESVSPKPLSKPFGPFRIFSKIRGYIRSSMCTSINDTDGKIADQLINSVPRYRTFEYLDFAVHSPFNKFTYFTRVYRGTTYYRSTCAPFIVHKKNLSLGLRTAWPTIRYTHTAEFGHEKVTLPFLGAVGGGGHFHTLYTAQLVQPAAWVWLNARHQLILPPFPKKCTHGRPAPICKFKRSGRFRYVILLTLSNSVVVGIETLFCVYVCLLQKHSWHLLSSIH